MRGPIQPYLRKGDTLPIVRSMAMILFSGSVALCCVVWGGEGTMCVWVLEGGIVYV